MRGSIVRLFDEENVYDFADYSNSEIDEFIDSLTVDLNLKRCQSFFRMCQHLDMKLNTHVPSVKQNRRRS